MDWQQAASLLIVGITLGLFAWRQVRPRKFRFDRDTHCGCSGSAASQGSVLFQARKGERPRIVMKTR